MNKLISLTILVAMLHFIFPMSGQQNPASLGKGSDFYAANQVRQQTDQKKNKTPAITSYSETENSSNRLKRNMSSLLVATALCILHWLLWKNWGFKTSYFLLAFTTITFTSLVLVFQNQLPNIGELANQSVVAGLVTFPFLLLISSISNVFRKEKVDDFLSLIFGLASLNLLVFYAVDLTNSGKGIL